MEPWQLIVVLAAIFASCIAVCVAVSNSKKNNGNVQAERFDELKNDLFSQMDELSHDFDRAIEGMRVNLGENLTLRVDVLSKQMHEKQSAFESIMKERLDSTNRRITDGLDGIIKRVDSFALHSEERYKSFEAGCIDQMNVINTTLHRSLDTLRESNDKHLDDIRGIVDEKLQRTLNERITESFKLVNDRLAEVYKGLGEMQALASGVGDLKRVLSNVKTRGTLGEIQLGAILDEILAPEQFERNFDARKSKSNERVEFAIRMPYDGKESVFLPIDSKFPADTFIQLTDAYESGNPDTVASARKNLCDTLRKCAKDIRDKYINPPRTTDFAIMFLPTEGLYAEAVKLGLVEKLQSEFKVNIAGPSTMAALLNSLQMGFKTLAIQKRSSEVWEILATIKKEFENFSKVLDKTQKALNSANNELESLVGVRTRQIIRALKKVEQLPQNDAKLLDTIDIDDEE